MAYTTGPCFQSQVAVPRYAWRSSRTHGENDGLGQDCLVRVRDQTEEVGVEQVSHVAILDGLDAGLLDEIPQSVPVDNVSAEVIKQLGRGRVVVDPVSVVDPEMSGDLSRRSKIVSRTEGPRARLIFIKAGSENPTGRQAGNRTRGLKTGVTGRGCGDGEHDLDRRLFFAWCLLISRPTTFWISCNSRVR